MGIKAKDLEEGAKGMTAKEMLSLFEKFLKDVEAEGYEHVPTISVFADSIGKSRADVFEWFRLHPTESGQMREMCADTLATGAMLKKYDARVTSFALKNWCGWDEAPQKKAQKSTKKADEKAAKDALEEYVATERRAAFKVV